MPSSAPSSTGSIERRLTNWFFEGYRESASSPTIRTRHATDWWKVMCLTGVDYFSTLAYQPSIAFLAAGMLAPLATLVLVALTLAGALPMYRRVAAMSPFGQGSILILEKLFPRWKGKVVVLSLLGFAATSFVITITLSAADAAAHLIENPLAPTWLDQQMAVTIVLLLLLGAIFLKGFQEAIGLAVIIVGAYLALNTIVLAAAMREIWRNPELIANWRSALLAQHGSPAMMVVMAVILFPKHGFRVLQCQSPAIPNAIAALLLHIRNRTGHIPHVYFGWTEGNPIAYLMKFLAFGEGDTAPVTREVLRLAEPDPLRRPRVHVG